MAGVQLLAACALGEIYFAMTGARETAHLVLMRYGIWAMVAASVTACLWINAARLRDLGRSGWHQAWVAVVLFGLAGLENHVSLLTFPIFLGGIAYLAVAPGTRGANAYGPEPA